ncbi:MAG TPA: prepilin peptidase [Stellaceae bacterium]|nr:prepilin peptidase [Stellaceae bacterium]
MTAALHLIAVGAFAALMAMAAFEDFRRFVIPNWLILALIAVWPLFVLAGTAAFAAALGALAIAAAVFLVGALLFGRGLVGGGDVKLLTVAALWAGPAATPELLVVTAALGGVLSLVLLSPLGAHLSFAGRLFLGAPGAPATVGKRVPVPYGIAIAGGALFVTLQPFFG